MWTERAIEAIRRDHARVAWEFEDQGQHRHAFGNGITDRVLELAKFLERRSDRTAQVLPTPDEIRHVQLRIAPGKTGIGPPRRIVGGSCQTIRQAIDTPKLTGDGDVC
jgi:hypothetical protein